MPSDVLCAAVEAAGYPETIIRQFTNASFRAIGKGRQLVHDLETVYEGWSERVTSR